VEGCGKVLERVLARGNPPDTIGCRGTGIEGHGVVVRRPGDKLEETSAEATRPGRETKSRSIPHSHEPGRFRRVDSSGNCSRHGSGDSTSPRFTGPCGFGFESRGTDECVRRYVSIVDHSRRNEKQVPPLCRRMRSGSGRNDKGPFMRRGPDAPRAPGHLRAPRALGDRRDVPRFLPRGGCSAVPTGLGSSFLRLPRTYVRGY
jgi:hypothetical protein